MTGAKEPIDFLLEEKNKRTKMWAPAGVPEHQQWLRMCLNIDKLDQVIILRNRVTSSQVSIYCGTATR